MIRDKTGAKQEIKRDELGRFPPGVCGNPNGRPRKPKPEYLQAILDLCTVDDWKRIVSSAVVQARGGDNSARQWLTKFLVPRRDEAIVEDITPFESLLRGVTMEDLADLPGEEEEETEGARD